jgi:hypothetical protein
MNEHRNGIARPEDGEPARDRALAERLRDAERLLYGAATDDVAAAARRRAIVHAAAPALARRRARLTTPATWWEWTASWSRSAIPIGVAAAAAAALLVIASQERTAAVLRADDPPEQGAVVAAALQSASAPEAVEAVIGEAPGEWLISAALYRLPGTSSGAVPAMPALDSSRR